jgi:hypothetical protein
MSVADSADEFAGSVADAATGSVAVWAGQSAADRFAGSVAVRARMREARPGPLVAGSASDRDGSAVDPGGRRRGAGRRPVVVARGVRRLPAPNAAQAHWTAGCRLAVRSPG